MVVKHPAKVSIAQAVSAFKSRMVRHFTESLAQLGERYPYKVDVIGSSPITFTNIEKIY